MERQQKLTLQITGDNHKIQGEIVLDKISAYFINGESIDLIIDGQAVSINDPSNTMAENIRRYFAGEF